MFVAAVVRLRLLEGATLPQWTGRAAHAWFFNLLAAADSAFATDLHDNDTTRPKGFTVSDLLGLPGRASLAAGQECVVRLTSYDPQLSALLLEKALPNLAERVQICEREFVVESWTARSEEHPLAGTVAPQEFAARHLFGGSTPPNRLRMAFNSPTTFSSNGRKVPLPLPTLVFGGYLDRWNNFAESQFSPDLRRFVDECVTVSRYRLDTQTLAFEQGAPISGFVGSCQFQVSNRDNYWLRLLHLLADFSFWCGTGYKTTMGMGQSRALAV